MNDVPKDVIEENYQRFKAIVLERADTSLATACGGPIPPRQPSHTPEEITSLVMGLRDDPNPGEIKMSVKKARGHSPLFHADVDGFFGYSRQGYKPGEVNIIAPFKAVIPNPIVTQADGSVFIPLEHTVEEGEAIMSSLTRKK